MVGGCGARAVSRKTPIYFIQVDVEAIKSINQNGNDLLSEAHGLKQPQVALHHHKVLHLLRIQPGPLGPRLGGDHIAAQI